MKTAYDLAALERAIAGISVETNPALVRQKSRDFFWYSPILKRQLDHLTGDIVVTPRSTDDVVRVLAAAFTLDIPVTVRGSGTGNYGQAMPLAGGIVLNMAEMADVRSITPGRVRCGAGAILAEVDAATRAHSGQELRMHPSTYNTASVGGFVAGGSGGIGSINWGGLRDAGNVLSVELVTMEQQPRVLRLRGEELAKIVHAYGTNGVITEVEMPLTAAYPWIDVIVGFDSFAEAARFGNALGEQDGILTKLITSLAAPIPESYFLRHRRHVPDGTSVVLVMVADHSKDAFNLFVSRFRSAQMLVDTSRMTTEETAGLPVNFELSWNHTTLRALRVDPTVTYLQVLYPFPDQLATAAKIHGLLGDEVLGHLEFVRFDGKITCFGLPIVRYTAEDRLSDIIRLHEDHGAPIFNPHRYTLEEGGMKQTDAVQLAFKKEADPRGLLNPGKMIAWDDPSFNYADGKTYLYPSLAASEAVDLA